MSKQQKKPEKSKPMIPIEDHKREMAKKDEAIKQVKAETQRIKSAALDAVKEFKERFDMQKVEIETLKNDVVVEQQSAEDAVEKMQERIDKLNEDHGKTVKRLREALEAKVAE